MLCLTPSEDRCSSPPRKPLTHRGRQLEIASTGERRVSFDLVDFYHNETQLFGVDTRARDAIASAVLLEALVTILRPGYISSPLSIDGVLSLSPMGAAAYDKVDRGQVRGRIVLAP